MAQTPEVFERLVKLRPKSRHLWYARGRMYAASREWDKSAGDIMQAIALSEPRSLGNEAEVGPWVGWCVAQQELGSLLLLAGDKKDYQELCQSLLETQLPQNAQPILFSCASRAATMCPDALADFSKPLQWASYSVAKQPRVAWHLYGLGIAQHRVGKCEEAIVSLQKSLAVNRDWVGRGQNYATLALACNSLGRQDEARQWLNQTRSWLKEVDRNAASWKFGFAASDYLSDWLCAQVLLREAESLVSDGDKS
jgi:tetratricopeptide (TPR) repeat protein